MKYPDPLLTKYITTESKVNTKGDANKRQESYIIDFEGLKEEFYIDKLDDSSPKEVCLEYFKGLLFVLRYYIQGMPDWHYTYKLNYTPFFTDMYKYIGKFDGEMKFDLHSPLSPFEQLLAVLPTQSMNILPMPLRPLLSSNSPILDFYPEKFEVDMEGKQNEWEGHPILPFIDVKRLKDAYKTVEKDISADDIKRNRIGKNTLYRKRGNGIQMSLF